MRRINSVGKRFGRLLVLAQTYRNGEAYCLCLCDCRTVIETKMIYLRQGDTKSCGCYNREQTAGRAKTRKDVVTRHGMSHSVEYQTWADIKHRCKDTNNPHYGGRGIKICSGWAGSFESFYQDHGPRPAGLTIERIDNNGHYSCGHCEECASEGWVRNTRWATWKEQAANRRPRQPEKSNA